MDSNAADYVPGKFRTVILFEAALVAGVSIGLVYGLIAIGMLMVYTVNNVINLANGEMITIGMYFTLPSFFQRPKSLMDSFL